ncbi:MAG TPA: deoxyribose-phosphate aldolase, partial [Tissierellaceae bacterium]
ANEIDMVINITDLKNKNYDKILEEINLIKKEIKDKTLKVIIETCYLSNEEKVKMCEIISNSNADYIKTSTGFGSQGASIEDIKLFRQNLSKDKKIKAAGGIKTKEDMIEYINLGCNRLGTSSAVKILFYK